MTNIDSYSLFISIILLGDQPGQTTEQMPVQRPVANLKHLKVLKLEKKHFHLNSPGKQLGGEQTSTIATKHLAQEQESNENQPNIFTTTNICGFFSPANIDEPNIWRKNENEVGESEHHSTSHHRPASTESRNIFRYESFGILTIILIQHFALA